MPGEMSMLGLCMRARRLACGIPAVEQAVRAGQAHLVLVDGGASALSRKSVADACAFRGVRFVTVPAGEIGAAVGRPGRMAVAVTDEGFAKAIAARLDQVMG